MRVFFTVLAMSLLMLNVAVAQDQRPQRQGGRPGGGGGGPGTPGSSTLERAGLKIGQAMPDLSIYDSKGEEFRIADLKGKHSVIVFGCLT